MHSHHSILRIQREPHFECHECEYNAKEKGEFKDHVKKLNATVKVIKEVFFECYKCDFTYKMKNNSM